MAKIWAEWASRHRQITKIMPSDGCGRDAVPSTVARGYDLRKPGCHLGNVDQDDMLCEEWVFDRVFHATTRSKS